MGLGDEVVQMVFAAGLSLRATAALSDQPEVVRRLEQLGSDLDVIVRHVWQSNFAIDVHLGQSDVPLGPSDVTVGVSASERGPRSKRPPDLESG